jgi:hypothetical protein
MDRTKILIGVLILLGLLFFCGIGAGFTVGSGPPGNAPSNDGLRGLLEKAVSLQELSASPSACLQSGVIVLNSGASCTITIQASDATARRLQLQITQGHVQAMALTLKFPSPRTPTPPIMMTSHPTPAATLSLDIFREGGTLEVSCSGGTQCRIRIVQ